jgi:signal transduction histidine kinase
VSTRDGTRGWREWAADALIWAVLAAPVAANQLLDGAWFAGTAAVAAMALAVAAARRAPLVGWFVVVAGTFFDGNFVFAVAVLSYLVGLRTERVRPVVRGFLAITAAGTALNVGVLHTGPAEWFVLAMMLAVVGLFPWLAGRYQAQRARLVSAGWERAARLEYERRILVRQARLRERARIAQEMHDSLGHELALIALGAGGLQTSPGLAEPHRAAAGRIRESAATATDQLREIIGVLRDDEEELPFDPADEPVEALVTRARAAGMAVAVRRSGRPDTLPAAVERTAHRVVREALTNASRHAPGAGVSVVLAHRDDGTTVSVVNDRPARMPAADTTGVGLVGLRERVRLAGGTLTAGPTPDGGFRTAAELPHRAGAGPATEPPVVTELRSARQRARRSLAAAVLTPAALALVAAVGYHSVAVSGAVLAADAFDRMSLGTPRAELALPARQVWQHPAEGLPPTPPDARCEFYTDGNFPLADASFRLCFTGGRLVAKDRLS